MLTKRFKDGRLIIMSLWLMFIGLVGWAITPNVLIMLITILPLAGGGWIANTILTSGISKAVTPDEIGGMLGISNSVESVTRVISPSIGGLLFGGIGVWAPGVFSAVMILLALWLAYQRIILINEKETEMTFPTEECCA
jgi:DHA1 family tetracycline resistance protein-like MFS transporter